MMPSKKIEFFHSTLLLIVTFIAFVLLLFPFSLTYKLFVWAVMFLVYLKNGLKISMGLKLLILSFFFSLSFVALGLIYPTPRLMTGEVVNFLGKDFYKLVLLNSLDNFVRILLLSHLSMSSSYAISYTKVILSLIVKNYISPNVGYPLLIAINSISLIKDEFIKIRTATKYRKLGYFKRIFILFPILVFAIRQAQRGAMSLVTRGLSSQKSYYYKYEISKKDLYIFSSLNFILILFGLLIKLLAISI